MLDFLTGAYKKFKGGIRTIDDFFIKQTNDVFLSWNYNNEKISELVYFLKESRKLVSANPELDVKKMTNELVRYIKTDNNFKENINEIIETFFTDKIEYFEREYDIKIVEKNKNLMKDMLYKLNFCLDISKEKSEKIIEETYTKLSLSYLISLNEENKDSEITNSDETNRCSFDEFIAEDINNKLEISFKKSILKSSGYGISIGLGLGISFGGLVSVLGSIPIILYTHKRNKLKFKKLEQSRKIDENPEIKALPTP